MASVEVGILPPALWGDFNQTSAPAGVTVFSQQASTLSLILQVLLSASVLIISALHSIVGHAIFAAHSITTGTARAWGWGPDAVYLVEMGTNALLYFLSYQLLCFLQHNSRGNTEQRLLGKIARLERHNADTSAQLQAERRKSRTLAEAVELLKQQIAVDIPNHLRAAVALGLDVTKVLDLAPLLDFASAVAAGGHALETADMSDVRKMGAFQGFEYIRHATLSDEVQLPAQRKAVTLLMVMLRCLSVSQPLREAVRAALLPDFVGEHTKWSTLSQRLYSKWDDKGLGDILAQIIGEEQMQLVRHKHTRVAAMQLLALLMHHGYVMA